MSEKSKITSANIESESNKNMVNENNKTKKKSNAQKTVPILICVIVALLIILTCVLIAYYQIYNSGKQNENVLEGVYASSYYSMVDNVNNLAVDISKYSTLTTNQAKLKTMQDMMLDCNYILAGLSVLPISEEQVVSATKFFNQVNGLCQAYSNQLNKNQNLTIEQELVFDKVAIVVGKIKANFNEQNYGMYDTGFNFIDAGFFDNTGMNELTSGMGDLTSDSIDYPAMIFDGPFSTALETKNVLGLKGKEISKEQAEDYLKNTVYKNRDIEIEYQQETAGDLTTYDFIVTIEGKDYNAQVSKTGSLLITISSYAEEGKPIIGKEQATLLAENFTNNIGFENMKSVWNEINKNVAYINLAPIQNDVILYPDLVKVKVDLTSQEIIGFEAVNYAFNHTDRNFEFIISEIDAEEKLGFDYEIISTSKAIIKLEGGREVATYEFFVERIDGKFFYYINAATNEIEKTMKLVNVEDSEKLI